MAAQPEPSTTTRGRAGAAPEAGAAPAAAVAALEGATVV
jgi:hypothetical protein